MRLAACLGVPVDVIEPAGFVLDDPRFRRAGMDYIDHADITRHMSWDAYRDVRDDGRIVLLTTRATQRHVDFHFTPDDTLLLGRETDGVPDEIHDLADARIRVPMRREIRSLNVVTALAIVLGEATRQLGGFPE